MRKKAIILGLAALALATWAAPSFAAQGMQGAVGQVQGADAAALGLVSGACSPAGNNCVGFRIWSAFAGGLPQTTVVNQNTASCLNVRCLRTYVTNTNLNPGGYVGNQENTGVYNQGANNQPFYELADASMNDGAGNHIGYYGVSGISADSTAAVGSFLGAGCSGATPLNCFGRLDNALAAPPLAFTNTGFPSGGHSIRAIGGLNPIPTVRVSKTGGGGNVQLSWNDPSTYDQAMRPGVSAGAPPSPVLGVRLWKVNSAGCVDPAGNAGWVSVGTFGLGSNTSSQPLPPPNGSCDYYALTVRLVGPAGPPAEVETFRVGANSQGVSNSPTAVRIVHFDAQYAGHGVVNVSWQSGVEGGLSGFYVTRSQNASGPYARVSELIRAKGDNSNYSTNDRVAAGNARVYYYQLEAIGRDGSVTNSSPAAVTLPSRSKKAGPSVR